jgi:hypothetical protein
LSGRKRTKTGRLPLWRAALWGWLLGLCGVVVDHQDRPRDSILDGESARRLEDGTPFC